MKSLKPFLTMIPREILRQIRRIEITTSRLVTDVFAGQYHSAFKGQGIEFEEVREYQIGDDIRTIDWNVTARTGRAHVKKFTEEREMTVMILVDASASSHFASVNKLKSQLAAEIAALLAFSAIRNQDKAGLIIFTDRIEKFIPPRKGISHVLRLIREVLYFNPQGKKTDIVQAIEFLNKVTIRKSVAFVISDFLVDELFKDENRPLRRVLSIANKRHDLIAVCLNDPREEKLPAAGIFCLEDAESGEQMFVDASDRRIQQEYQQKNRERLQKRANLFNSVRMDYINLSTEGSYTDEIVKFFLKRKRRY